MNIKKDHFTITKSPSKNGPLTYIIETTFYDFDEKDAKEWIKQILQNQKDARKYYELRSKLDIQKLRHELNLFKKKLRRIKNK